MINRISKYWIPMVAVWMCASWFGGHSDIINVPNARSAYAPSLAVFDGALFLAWRGEGSPDMSTNDQRLYLSSFSDNHWTSPILLPGKSMFGPVLAATDEKLFVAWHGPGNLFTGAGDSRMYFGYLQKGGGFHHLGVVPDALSAGPPGIAVYEGLVYVGWRALGNVTVGMVPGNQHWILYGTFDPSREKWSIPEHGAINIVHANSASGPCFTSVGDRLYALWRGTGSLTFYGPNSDPGDPFIYYAFFDGESWSALNLPLPTVPGALTAWGPGAVEWKGGLCIGWRGDQPRFGAPGSSEMRFANLHDESGWKSLDLFGASRHGSAFGPAMASDKKQGKLWVAWRGVYDREKGTDDQQLYLTEVKDPNN